MTRTAAIYQQLGIIRNKKGKESNASITPRQDLAFHLLLNLYRLTGNVIFHVSCVSETSGTVGVDRMSDMLTSLSFVSLTFGMFAFFSFVRIVNRFVYFSKYKISTAIFLS